MEKKTLCRGCSGNCGLVIEYEGDKPIKLTGDKDHPLSKGIICGRPKALVFERTNHPDRIRYPLKRMGQRGSGKWQRISWDQALEEISAKLTEIKKNFGAESIVIHPNNGMSCGPVIRRFANLLGTPNMIEDGWVCSIGSRKIDIVTFGWLSMHGDRRNSKCIVIWGGNPANSHPVFFREIKDAKEQNGAKVIVIDPKYTQMAKIADIWLQLRPASDLTLLLCWINTIINEELYDKDFVEKWTNAPYLVRADTQKIVRESDVVAGGDRGKFVAWDVKAKKPVAFDRDKLSYKTPVTKVALAGDYVVTMADGKKVECKTVWQLLKERVAPYAADKVAGETWVPADKILEAARMYATNKPAIFEQFLGLDSIGETANQACRARSVLRAITGSIDIKGGDIFPGPYTKVRFDSEIEESHRLSPEQKKKALGTSDKYRLGSWESHEELWEYQKKAGYPNPLQACQLCMVHKPSVHQAMLTGEPYPVKAFLVIAANPLLMSTNTSLVYEAYKKLDLLVVSDLFMTPTAEMADYVLPGATYGMESPKLHTYWNASASITSGYAGVTPPGECYTDWKLVRELGVKMGQDWPWKTEEDMYNWMLEPMGYTWKDFVKNVRWIIPQTEYKKYEKTGFGTESGKVEIYSSHLEKLGYDPLPDYHENIESPLSTPELAKQYPYIMAAARVPLFYNAEGHQFPSVRKTRPDPLILINPKTADKLGIKGGDWVWIESPLGKKRIKQKAELFDGIHPNVVYPDIGRWYPERPAPEHGLWDSNINVIISDAPQFRSPMLGTWPFSGMLCNIYKE